MSIDPVNPYAASLSGLGIEPMQAPAANFGSILRLGRMLYFTNFGPVSIVTVVVWTPLVLFHAYMGHFVFDDFRDSQRLYRILDGVFGIIATGSVIAIGGAAMRGEQMSWWGGLQEGLLAWPRMFWTRIVYGFAIVIALIAFILPALFFGVRLMLTDQVTVLDRESGGESIKRSYELTEEAYWRLLGMWVITTIALLLVAIVVASPVIFIPELDHWLVSAATTLVVRLFVPLQTLVFVAAYFAGEERLRLIRESEFVRSNSSAVIENPTDMPGN